MDSFTTVLIIIIAIGVMSVIVFRKKEIELGTSDGVEIIGRLVDLSGAEDAVIFLHMMPGVKEDYENLMNILKKEEVSSLAIDLRGHGESEGGPYGYRNFSETEHQKSIEDVKAASKYLEKKGYPIDHQYIVGASIGANLALWFASSEASLNKTVLLSPGIDYQGIKGERLMRDLDEDQNVLIVSSDDDKRRSKKSDDGEEVSWNVEMCKKLIEAAPDDVDIKFLEYNEAGHGTDMFDVDEKPDLETEILQFLND